MKATPALMRSATSLYGGKALTSEQIVGALHTYIEYVMPRDTISDKKKMTEIFASLEDYCFCGHTHTPGVFTPNGFSHPSDMFDLYILGSHEKVLVNVGSVGQPRDGDPRACFVTFDGDTIVWRRVEYDVEATCGKIYSIPELDDFLADRLREGK